MRLPAALWLTDDYYMDIDGMERSRGEEADSVEMEAVTAKPGSASTLSVVGLLDPDARVSISLEEMFPPSRSCRGIMVRIIFLISLIGSVALSIGFIASS
jgi:hypothetical protein